MNVYFQAMNIIWLDNTPLADMQRAGHYDGAVKMGQAGALAMDADPTINLFEQLCLHTDVVLALANGNLSPIPAHPNVANSQISIFESSEIGNFLLQVKQ